MPHSKKIPGGLGIKNISKRHFEQQRLNPLKKFSVCKRVKKTEKYT